MPSNDIAMSLTATRPGQLLALGGLGAVMLWGVAFFNGTLDNSMFASATQSK